MNPFSQENLFEPDAVIPSQRRQKSRATCLESSDEDEVIPNETIVHSTPLNSDRILFEDMKRKVNEKLVEHKSQLKRLRDEEKANNEEWLSVLSVVLSGKKPDIDNITDRNAMMWGDLNLLEVLAGPEPSKFGSKLAVAMFGSKEACLLKTHIIGPVRNRKETREPINEEHRKTFEGLWLNINSLLILKVEQRSLALS